MISGQPGTSHATGLAIPTGYKLAEGQTLPENVMMPESNQTVTIHLVHGTTTITPETPGVTPTDPDYQDMFKTVTWTIIVENPLNGNDETHQQAVQFSRSKTIDSVTKAVLSYGAWTPTTATWDEFDAPDFAGYTPSQAKVDAETVTADTHDTTVVISYQHNGTPATPGEGGHHTNPGDNGGQPSTGNNDHGSNGGNGNGSQSEAVETTNNGQKNNKQALPQTGNADNSAAVAGLSLASLVAMLGLAGGRRKKNDQE